MKRKWILFYREMDEVYYFYNGEHPICVSPQCNDRWIDKFGELPEATKAALDGALKERRRVLLIGDVRYVIAERGEFHEGTYEKLDKRFIPDTYIS